MDPNRYDHLQRRCPMLGHEVAFSYCRAPGCETVCRRILDCWWERFDIRGFIADFYGLKALEALQAPSPSKPAAILELVRQAQRLNGA